MIIEAASIEKWYYRKKGGSNRHFAVKNADLKLMPGQVTVLTGRSGSGKTTLLHMVSGLLVPSAGKVSADGEDLYSMDDRSLSQFRNQHFGMIPQGADLLPQLTVRENLLLPQRIWGNRREKDSDLLQRQETEQAILEKLGIGHLADVPAKELSGGERRRVCVARGISGSPDVIYADEPTSDLDDENMRTVLQLLRDAANAGSAVLIVSHDSEALEYADVQLHMNSQ